MSNNDKTQNTRNNRAKGRKDRRPSSNKKNVSNSGNNKVAASRDTKFTSVNDSIFGDPIPKNLSSAGRDNDPNWYFLDSGIAEQASGISFNQYIGSGFPITLASAANVSDQTIESEVQANYSTLLTYEMAPSPGDVSSLQNGINMASLATYSTLSSMNAKTTGYQPQDISILILSLGEVISVIEHIRRAFGVAFTYNQRNRTMPREVLNAMGFNTDDFLNNIAQHRLQFNSKITAINKIPFLDNIAYLYKCANLYQKVYMDRDSAMSQLCLAKPETTWILDEAYNDNGSGLVTTSLPRSFTENNWDKWMEILDNQIEALLTSSTFNFVYSDILNYSSKTGAKLLYMDYLQEGYSVVPEYNHNFLLQMHNSTLIGPPVEQISNPTVTLNNVSCDVNKNKLVYSPIFKGASRTVSSPIIDFETPAPSLEDKIEATRFVSVLKEIGSGDNKYAKPEALPDHYVIRMRIYGVAHSRKKGDIVSNSQFSSNLLDAVQSSATYDLWNHVVGLSALSNFDWFPTMYVINENTSETNDAQISIFSELSYFTTLDTTWFKRVNDLGFQALFTLR